MLTADVDVNDVESENGNVTLFAPANEFSKARQALLEALPGVELDVEEISFIPQTRTEVGGDDLPMFDKFIAMLDDCDDVQDVYHNAIVNRD